MTPIAAVRCNQCGGAVSAAFGFSRPACVFCGADVAELVAIEADVDAPVGAGPFLRTEAQARRSFQRFARSNLFYPSDLRDAELELQPIRLPAWSFSGTVETHFTGLVRAVSASGKAPVSGRETERFTQVLVAGSATLSQNELEALGPFRSTLEPFDPDRPDLPFEVSTITADGARDAVRAELVRRHAEAIVRKRSLIEIRPSAGVHELTGQPVLVPVYVGAYRYRDVPYRFLVNGQTGRTYGEAPKSPWRVALLVAAIVVGLLVMISAIRWLG